MEIAFNTNGAGVAETSVETPTEATPANEVTSGGKVYANADELAKAQAAPIPVPSPGVPATIQSGQLAPSGIVLGDTIPDFKDIILPRLNIVQGVGQLKDQFPVGAIIFGQNTVLFTPPAINPKTGNVDRAGTPPVNVTVLGFRPVRYVEKIVGGARGMICDTEAAVRAAGGTLDYNEHKAKAAHGMKLFQPLAEALMAIERPLHCADDDTVFVYPVEEGKGDVKTTRKFALALWAMKGTAFTAVAKRVFMTSRAVGCLRKGYPSYGFNLTTRFESFNGGNGAWVPVAIPAAKSTPNFINFARAILNPAG
jgi:hypothetical protein